MNIEFDPDVLLPQPDAELAAAVAGWPAGRILQVTWNGKDAWLKRARDHAGAFRRFRRRVMVACGIKGATWSRLPEPGVLQLQREARRLIWLRDQGFSVPAVYGVGAGWMLMESRGESVRTLMPNLTVPERVSMMVQILEDMAALHALGLWRGGAQLKNTVVGDGKRSMIDFEDGFGPEAGITDLQARDIFLFLQSCADWTMVEGLIGLLQRYREIASSTVAINRARHTIGFMASGWSAKVPGGDVRRARAVALALQSFS